MKLPFVRTREDRRAAERARLGQDVGKRIVRDPAIQSVPIEGMQVYLYPDFLDQAECDGLVAMIDGRRRPSTLLSDNPDKNFRTSDSCDMDRWAPDVRPIDEKIADLLGIPYQYGETMQGQRYAIGQQFRAHHDYFFDTQSYWAAMQKEGGQRTWTAMIFLNDVAEGGATWFPLAGIRVTPKRGLLLAWNNMSLDGSPNYKTLHEGMPVTEGTKYIVTKWFREDPWIDYVAP